MDKSRVLEAIRNGSIDPFFSSLYHKDSPSAPPAPNYAAAAQAQGQANIDTARLQGRMNNPNIITPYGTQTVTWGNQGRNLGGNFGIDQNGGLPQNFDMNNQQYDPGYGDGSGVSQSVSPQQNNVRVMYGGEDGTTPFYLNADGSMASGPQSSPSIQQSQSSGQNNYYGDQPTVTQTLAPAQQKLLDSQNRISQNLADIGTSELPRLQRGLAQPLDTQSAKDAVAKAYGDITSRLDPQWQAAQAQNETKLRNQGLTPGGEAYDAAMRNFNQGKNDAYTQANLAAMGYAPTTMQMDITGRDQLLNELNALRSGSQVQNPQFQPYSGSNIGQTPIMQGAQAQGAANQGLYNAQVGQNNAFNSGLFQMGAAAIPFLL